jgi:hypothetical protein
VRKEDPGRGRGQNRGKPRRIGGTRTLRARVPGPASSGFPGGERALSCLSSWIAPASALPSWHHAQKAPADSLGHRDAPRGVRVEAETSSVSD